jgi:hypothetical protein
VEARRSLLLVVLMLVLRLLALLLWLLLVWLLSRLLLLLLALSQLLPLRGTQTTTATYTIGACLQRNTDHR